MDSDSFDLVVIGCGPAGEKAAAQAAYFGKRVAIVERAQVGGTCINSGTVPSKTLRESALYFSGLKQRDLYGISYSLNKDLTTKELMFRERAVVELEKKRVQENLIKHGIALISGTAAFINTHTVQVSQNGVVRTIRAEIILIATGSSPFRPPKVDFDNLHVFDSDTFLNMKRIPKSLVVVGGGVVGCEYASMFTALGVDVTLIDGKDRLLPFLDAEFSALLLERFRDLGMKVRLNERPTFLQISSDSVQFALQNGSVLDADCALYAAGRRATVDGLYLDKAGLELNERGHIVVDEHYRTKTPNIYAAGDVIGFPSLASVSMEQGRLAICHAFGFTYKQRLASHLPLGIFTIPEISAVGETEESCREKHIDYCVGKAHYQYNTRGQIIGDTSGLLKLIFSRNDKKLLGINVMGESATELIHIGMMALDNGLTIDAFIDQLFNYPTLSELYKYAAYDGLGNLAGHKLREG